MRLLEWFRRLVGPRGGARRRSTDPPELQAERILAEIEAAELASGDPYGLHEVAKKLDNWFGIEVGRLERDARQDAIEWARAGLPRPGADDAALPVEARLAARAAELYRKWVRLLLTKVQDGIAAATRRAGQALIQYGEGLTALRRTRSEIEATRSELAAAQAHAETQQPPSGVTRHLRLWKFWVLIVLLILVDWVANVPVFQELLPRETGADELWATIVAHSESRGALGGLYRVWMRTLFAPDVSILALGVIAFLVFLAHVAGDAARHLMALGGRVGRRRHYLVPLVGGLLGAAAVVAVLYMARERIKAESDLRLAEAVEEVRALEARLDAANASDDLVVISQLTNRLPAAQAQVEDRRARARYAAAIQAMNAPITGLNIILIIASALASYLAADITRSEGRPTVPRVARLEARLRELSEREAGHRAVLRETAERIQAELGQADRLIHSRPLQGADEKVKRLQSVIALFRAENARERGIDPVTIQAFQKPIELDTPSADLIHEPLEEPSELHRYREEFQRLRERYVGRRQGSEVGDRGSEVVG